MHATTRALSLLLLTTLATASGSAAEDIPSDILPWRNYAPPEFPLSLLPTPVRDGHAIVVFTFDDSGRITDKLAFQASNPAFAIAVLEATRSWIVDTDEIPSEQRRAIMRFEFHREAALVSMTQRDASKALFSPFLDGPKMAVHTVPEADLDHRLVPVEPTVPKYPPELQARGVRGNATVSFIVDADGRVRVPAVTRSTDSAFGAAVLEAVRQWRFEPPRQGALPVQVAVDRAFAFGASRTDPTP